MQLTGITLFSALTSCGGHKSFEPIKEKIKLTPTLTQPITKLVWICVLYTKYGPYFRKVWKSKIYFSRTWKTLEIWILYYSESLEKSCVFNIENKVSMNFFFNLFLSFDKQRSWFFACLINYSSHNILNHSQNWKGSKLFSSLCWDLKFCLTVIPAKAFHPSVLATSNFKITIMCIWAE